MERRGLMAAGQLPLSAALNEFKLARRRATLEMLTGRLRGRSVDLLSFNEIADMLKVHGRSERGVQDIPIAAIVGSVGRYNDFTRSFLPRQDWDATRWARVKMSGHVVDLPPIEVYKVGEAYFVLDGNHRVSIARRLGVEYIHAHVIEVKTRVPIDPTIQPDELIIKAEYVAFLEWTQLDKLRPFANLQVTVPGRYQQLENHIEVHRFFIEMEEEIELPDDEAVTRWFDEAYLPLVKAIREQDVLHEFPGRTETDLYVWLAAHQAELRNLLGWEVRPGTAVSQLSARMKRKGLMARAYETMLHVVVPNGWQGQSLQDWTEERMVDRYSRNLFGEILVPMTDGMTPALEQAIVIAQKENGRVVGLYTGDDEQNADQQEARFREVCAAAQVTATWVAEPGTVADIVMRRAQFADLVVLMAEQITPDLLAHTARPILAVTGDVSSMNKALLMSRNSHDTSLFVAAYLAETWGTTLVVLENKSQSEIETYLDFHMVTAHFVSSTQPRETAVQEQCDLIICGRNGRMLETVQEQNSIPLLIC